MGNPRYLRTSAAAALAFLLLLAAGRGDRSAAQDTQAAAAHYLASALLTRGDIDGYRVDNAGPAQPSGAEIARRQATFVAEPQDAPRVGGFLIVGAVFPDVAAADAEVASYHQDGSTRLDDGTLVAFTWDGPLAGVEQGERFRLRVESRGLGGAGAAWRRGQVAFLLITLAPIPQETVAEMLRIVDAQNARAARIGPFMERAPVPPPSPTSPPPPTPDPSPAPGGQPASQPDMSVLAAVQVGGALVRDGTVVTAMIGGVECGRSTSVFGIVVLIVQSSAGQPGCGAPGATVRFAIDGRDANETVSWSTDRFATPALLTAAGTRAGTDLIVRPLLDVACRPASAESACSRREQALWAGDLQTWLGEVGNTDAILQAWLRFRGDRGELLSQVALALLTGRPFTFIYSVQFPGGQVGPNVTLVNAGAERQVGGWTLTTDTGATFAFAADAVLPQGLCRVYLSPPGDDADTSCPGASFAGADELASRRQGYVSLTDTRGEVVDDVGW